MRQIWYQHKFQFSLASSLSNVPTSKFRILAVYVLAACAIARIILSTSASYAEPLYDSTADTVFDIIKTSDPSTFVCLSYKGLSVRQMWDKRIDQEYDTSGFLFHAYYAGTPDPVEILINPEFGSLQAAREQAEIYAYPLGQLPQVVRNGVAFIGVHDGLPTYSAGGQKIFVYAQRTNIRIQQGHLEESLFHEAVHVSLDKKLARSPEWLNAQQMDGEYLTEYGSKYPLREDLAETALFAFGLLNFPNRIPPVDSQEIRTKIASRLSVLSEILEINRESWDTDAREVTTTDRSASCRNN